MPVSRGSDRAGVRYPGVLAVWYVRYPRKFSVSGCQQSDRAHDRYPEELNVKTIGTPGIWWFGTFGTPGNPAFPCVSKAIALAFSTPRI